MVLIRTQNISLLYCSLPWWALKVNLRFEIPTEEESNQIILVSAGKGDREKGRYAARSLGSAQHDAFVKGPSL